MNMRPSALLDRARSPLGQRLVKYAMISVVATIEGQVVLFVLNGVLDLWSPAVCNMIAVTSGGVISYYANRRWAWGGRGRSHLWREVVPFWGLVLAGLAFSTLAVAIADSRAADFSSSEVVHDLLINAASIGSFGLLWIGKFVLFNKVIFVHHLEDLPETLDGRSGVPT